MINGGIERAKNIMVIKTESTRGSGKTYTDPVRMVTKYWDPKTGELLAETDPSKE